MESIGISVIMPSYLGKYPGSRQNADQKFIRAIESFQHQIYQHKELVIVSDGCSITNRIYEEQFKYDENITLIQCEKSSATWPGTLREVGRSIAKWDWIHYLDTDDYDMPGHLSKLANHIQQRNNETLFLSMKYYFPLIENPNELYLKFIGLPIDEYAKQKESAILDEKIGKIGRSLAGGHLGTWQIVHHRDIPHRWRNSSNIGEDRDFIQRIKSTEQWIEFMDGEHVVCHNNHPINQKTIWDI